MKINLLVIEDSEYDVEIIRFYLKEAGFSHNFFTSTTLKGGLDIIEENNIECVLLDLSLPDSDGFGTVKSFLKEVKHIPVIVMTNLANEVVGIQSVRAGAQDFLIKGEINNRVLIRTIRYSLQRFKEKAKLKDEAEKNLINKKTFQKAQEMAKFASWNMDIVNASMTWSEEMFRIFGFAPYTFDPTLSTYLNYVHMEDKEKVESFFEKVMKDGKTNAIDHRIIINGKSIKYLILHAEVNFDEDQNKILLIGSVQDITERFTPKHNSDKQPETKPSPSNIKEEVLSELNFNIRTPISSIANLLYLLEHTTKLSHSQSELVDSIKTSVNDLSIVLNNMLNFSLLITDNSEIEEEDFSFPDFCLGFQRVLQIRATQAGINLSFDIDKNLPKRIHSDPQKITQLLYNVVNNAINYSEEGDTIHIEIKGQKITARNHTLLFFVHYQTNNKLVAKNMTELRNVDKLLELYEDKKKSSRKKNFDKYIVARLIKTFNGNYQVLNKSDKKGISIKLDIPVKAVDIEDSSIDLNGPNSQLHILLVEDHAINQIATRRVLTSWSDRIKVDVANNGQKCLEKMETTDYDLILMDLQMPVMDGLEATRKIRESNNQLPIIALTANANKEEEEKCRSVGINDYLAKPFRPQELYTKIMKVEKGASIR
ncbi:MAG: response regulator [Saprospiraceae bacterium]|nr:response regulator [Saprospiraceae bacterium]